MSCTDILLHDNCTVSSLILLILLKQKVKEFHLIRFQVLCAINRIEINRIRNGTDMFQLFAQAS